MLMPSALLLASIFKIWGTFTSMEPAMMPIPRPLLSDDLKHGSGKSIDIRSLFLLF